MSPLTRVTTVLVAMCLVMPVSAQTQATPTTAAPLHDLVGTWRLVSMSVRDASGESRPYWGEQPTGLLIYTPEGQVAAQVYDARRRRLGVPWQSSDPEAARAAFVGLSTYFGTYRVDVDARTVTHIVEGSMTPDWVGTKLVRSFRFLDPDRVELGVVPDAQLRATGLVLVWQRVP